MPKLTSNVVSKSLHSNAGVIVIGEPGECLKTVQAVKVYMHLNAESSATVTYYGRTVSEYAGSITQKATEYHIIGKLILPVCLPSCHLISPYRCHMPSVARWLHRQGR